jgi:hypothetical protein
VRCRQLGDQADRSPRRRSPAAPGDGDHRPVVGAVGWIAWLVIGAALLAGCGGQQSAPRPRAEIELTGIWVLEDGDTLWRFGPGRSTAVDAGGELTSDPDDAGTFERRGSSLRLHYKSSESCPRSWEQHSRITPLGDGRFREHVLVADCLPWAADSYATWIRVSPRSRLRFDPPSAGVPLAIAPDPSNLVGVWLIASSSQLVSFSGDGRYSRDDRGRLGADPMDRGVVRIRGRRLLLRSRGTSTGCRSGDVLELRDVRFYQSVTLLRGLAARVARDTCAELARSGELVMGLIST